MLQFTLNELYQKREGMTMTYAAYRELGGLAGSIATTAERVLLSDGAGPVYDHPGANDLEPAALALMPEIGERMEQARAAGADHVLLSGSGPTVLGLFRDPGAHGTHVASIAAGSGVGQLSEGMAPEARIIVVSPHMKTSPNDPPSLGYSNAHVDALHFLKVAAGGNNAVLVDALPIAVNVSLGMNAGAHDGSSTSVSLSSISVANGKVKFRVKR